MPCVVAVHALRPCAAVASMRAGVAGLAFAVVLTDWPPAEIRSPALAAVPIRHPVRTHERAMLGDEVCQLFLRGFEFGWAFRCGLRLEVAPVCRTSRVGSPVGFRVLSVAHALLFDRAGFAHFSEAFLDRSADERRSRTSRYSQRPCLSCFGHRGWSYGLSAHRECWLFDGRRLIWCVLLKGHASRSSAMEEPSHHAMIARAKSPATTCT